MRLMTKDISEYTLLGWGSKVNSSAAGVSAYNSVLSSKAKVGESVYLETS